MNSSNLPSAKTRKVRALVPSNSRQLVPLMVPNDEIVLVITRGEFAGLGPTTP
jgi:hypothetical protein